MPAIRVSNTAANPKVLDEVENLDSIFTLAKLATHYPIEKFAVSNYILFNNENVKIEKINLAEKSLRHTVKEALLKIIVKAYPVTFPIKNISKEKNVELILSKYDDMLSIHKHLDNEVFADALLTIEEHARKLLDLITVEKTKYNVRFGFRGLPNNLYEYEIKEVVGKTPKVDSNKFRASIVSFVNKINRSIVYVDHDFIHKMVTIDNNKKTSLVNKYRTYEIDTYEALFKMFHKWSRDHTMTFSLERSWSLGFYTDYMFLYKYKDLTPKTRAAYDNICKFVYNWLRDVKVEAIIDPSSKDGCTIRVQHKKEIMEKTYYSNTGIRRKASKSK